MALAALAAFGTGGHGQGKGFLYQDPHRPDPCRKDTMMLDSLKGEEVICKPPIAKPDVAILRTHDIERACPTYPWKSLYKTGPPTKEEVPGGRSRNLYPDVNRPIDLSLTTRDIPGCQPSPSEFRTRRVVNPLTPRYDLPSFIQRPFTPPKPIFHEGMERDTMAIVGKPEVQRIPAGSRPRCTPDGGHMELTLPSRRRQLTPRNPLRVIEQAGGRILSSKHCPSHHDGPDAAVFGLPRSGHPLDARRQITPRTTHPFFTGTQRATDPAEMDALPGATPRELHRDNGQPQLSLITGDVHGASAQRFKGAMPYHIYGAPRPSSELRGQQLDCSDIPGAQTDTRRHGT